MNRDTFEKSVNKTIDIILEIAAIASILAVIVLVVVGFGGGLG